MGDLRREGRSHVVPAAAGSPGWLTRNLKIVSGVSLLQDAASELLYPILPIFLTVTLGAPTAVVGLVEGLAEGAASVTKVVTGRVSDRYRRRPLIGLGYGLAALGKVLIALATTWPVVLIGLAGYELLHHHLRPLLLIAVVPAVGSAALVTALHEPAPTAGSRHRARWRPGELPAQYWRVVAALTAFSVVNFPDALLLLRLHDVGFAVPAVIGAYVVYNLLYALLSYPAGAMADRLSPALVFGVGLVVFAVAYAGLGLTRSHLAAWLLIAGYGGFTALTDGVGKAWISGLLPPAEQGSGQGWFHGLTGLGVLVAGLWAGLAWGTDGQLPLLISGFSAAVLATALIAAVARS